MNFEEAYFADNGFAPNIRIVKFTSPYLVTRYDWTIGGRYSELMPDEWARVNSRRNDLRYFVTLGYEKFNFGSAPMLNISYCPFCGANLFKFYDKDKYVNEVEGKTFTL